MLDIKNKLYDVIGKLIYLIIGFIAFCIELVRHPINNISVWAIGGLACFINKYVELLLNANKMFSLSLGSLAIVFFITNYLESKVVDIDKKENFYLGFNIMRRRFHDNFWLQKFNDIPIKRFFWAIIAIPTIILCTELKYNIKILDDVTSVVNKNSRLIISIWVATFVISAFYCVAILIEAVSLSRKSFSKSALYDSSKWGEKIAIEYKVKKDFKKIFYDLFSIKYILESDVEFVTDVSNFINYIFNRAKEVSNNEEEINKYIELAFREESNVIENSLKRIIGIYGNKISNETIVAIKNYLIKKYIERLYWYFNNKWNTIKLLDIPPLILLKIARKDLRFLLEIERKLKSNDLYREIFWGKYRKHKHIILERNLLDSNLCVSQIEEILERKIEDINFLDKLNDTDIIFDILEILREIDDETKTTHYFTNIFATIYSCIYKVEMKDIKVIKEFFKKLKFKYVSSHLCAKASCRSRIILMDGTKLSANNIEYLLGFLNLNEIIEALIFNLAYREDYSDREIMQVEEFDVWKKIISNKTSKGESIDKLNENNYIQELCEIIGNTCVSHFVFKEYLEWLWKSLFEVFGDEKYEEFKNLGEKGVRRNFSLKSYVILRLLLCRYSREEFKLVYFSSSISEQVKKDLAGIDEILEREGIYL